MDRRSACVRMLAFLNTCLAASWALAAQEASRTVARIAGPRWNVNGDWTPSLDEIQAHLRGAHGIDPSGWGLEEMLILHDNDHNRRGFSGGHGHKKSPAAAAKGYARH